MVYDKTTHMQLVEEKDLMFGRKGVKARALASVLRVLLSVDKINELYAKVALRSDGRTAGEILDSLQVKYTVLEQDLLNIPVTGGVVIVANHPTGALDGIMLIDMISKIRPDVKFMGNFLLNRIEPLKRYFISVDPFDNPSRSRNTKGIRLSLEHLKAGGALVIFPAGEVATWQKGFSRVKDKPWSRSIVKFIRSAAVPVIPVCIEASNSRLFHLLGKIHPMLRTAMLPHEMFNKRGRSIDINIGAPLSVRRLSELDNLTTYGNFLRANVEYLRRKRRRRIRIVPRRPPREVIPDQIAASVGLERLRAELAKIRAEHMLFESGNYQVYFAPPSTIPCMMQEIGRMREITFREIGEGTMKGIDTDRYDQYYHQMFLWDAGAGTLVGAYRMGMGDEIVHKYGLKGFYTNSLFRMSDKMVPIMAKTIELGRSFITKEYQRSSIALLLLWKGILYVLLKHNQYRNLLGPVTVSGDFDRVSKTLIVKYLQKRHLDRKLSAYIHPVTGLQGIDAPIDDSLIDGVESIELINKIVVDIERNELSIPILIKKYLQLNSHVLSFNVDHDFCDALDALMLVDLKRIPESTILMLSKEITDIDVLARFKHIR